MNFLAISIVRISQFLVLPKKKGLPVLHFGVGFVSLRILILISAYMKKHKSPKSSEESSSITALRLENERLRAELKDAKMRAHAFDTMIDVAEEMFNLPIRKKAGTKQ